MPRNPILTHYGQRYALHLLHDPQAYDAADVQERRLLLPLLTERRPASEGVHYAPLFDAGLVEEAESGLTDDALLLRYRRNPLEHVERIVFEYTTACGSACLHCRNARLARRTVLDPAALARTADSAVALGIRRFDFIGGEVTRHGFGWLDLVREIRRHPGTAVGVISNGWFLGAQDFEAAGRRYTDHQSLLDDLREAGVTHIIFSVDGPEEVHDRWRCAPGLYRRVLAGIDDVTRRGLLPRVSVVLGPEVEGAARIAWLADLVRRLYRLPAQVSPEEAASLLLQDDTNYVSHLIDIGGAARMLTPQHPIDAVPAEMLHCKSFFRPHPSLRIQASGELSLCPLVDAGEGYGNVHERGLVDVVNRMTQTFVYRLHAGGHVGEYRRHLDRDLFGETIGHVCTLRAVLTLIAREMEERGVPPGDARGIREINEAVALRTGFLERR